MSSTKRAPSLSLVTRSLGVDAAVVAAAAVAGAAAVAAGDAAAAAAAAVVAAARPGDVAATAKRALNPVDKLAGLVQMLRTVLAVVHDLRAREPECHANYRRANGDVSAPWPVLAPCHCRTRPADHRC
jgi:hypothetical protein